MIIGHRWGHILLCTEEMVKCSPQCALPSGTLQQRHTGDACLLSLTVAAKAEFGPECKNIFKWLNLTSSSKYSSGLNFSLKQNWQNIVIGWLPSMLKILYWTIFFQSVKYVLLSCNLLSWHLGGDGNLSGKLVLCSFPADDEKLAFSPLWNSVWIWGCLPARQQALPRGPGLC